MTGVLRFIVRLPGRLTVGLVRGYQRFVSPFLPPMCRYTPSCSQYMIDAIRQRGFVIGLLKGTLRILRCNPFFPGGYDPVR
jgi:putative membrane protein insertion efficiency factor